MYCYKCGAQLDDEAIFCTSCGCGTKNYNASKSKTSSFGSGENSSPKSRLVATLLCFFLGVFGIHRFYLGKTGTGILWLFTCGCFFIGALIDFILLVCGTATDKDGLIVSEWN